MITQPTRCIVVAIWNMPWPFFNRAIRIVSGSNCGHVALALEFEDAPSLRGPVVWDAYAPELRRSSWDKYMTYLSQWRTRSEKKRRVKDSLRAMSFSSKCDEAMLARMYRYAVGVEGTPYSMFWNYIREGDRMHCSEFVSRCLNTGDYGISWDKPWSRVTPVDIVNTLRAKEWRQELIHVPIV